MISCLNKVVKSKPEANGLAVIIANEASIGVQPLRETMKDLSALRETFETLCFATLAVLNASTNDVRVLIDETSKSMSFPQSYRRFVFAFTGHGDEDIIGAHDGEVPIRDILNRFTPTNCPKLATVPKLFFFDTCRGGGIDKGVEVADLPKSSYYRIPSNNGNYLVAYSTMPSMKSFENPGNGSYWIQQVAKALSSVDLSVTDILTSVNREVFNEMTKRKCVSIQQPVFEAALHENVCLLKESKELDISVRLNFPPHVPFQEIINGEGQIGHSALSQGQQPVSLDAGSVRRYYENGLLLPKEVTSPSLKNEFNGHVATIDFGTTFSSIYYCRPDWADAIGVALNGEKVRVPTAILINIDGEMIAYGYQAGQRYLRTPPEERIKLHYFHHIKMLLSRDNTITRNSLVKDENGNEFYISEVIAMMLKYLKEQMLKSVGNQLSASDFRWVITVPTIWESDGKQLMRESAYLAGIASRGIEINRLSRPSAALKKPDLKKTDPSKLMLALEPEAAALYCKVSAQKIQHASSRATKYVVIDAGGGTLDVTAHCLSPSSHIEVIVPPLGYTAGGNAVNEEFMTFLEDLVEDKGFTRLLAKGRHNRIHLNVIRDEKFEELKTAYGDGRIQGMSLVIDFPTSFTMVYSGCLEENCAKYNGSVIYQDGAIEINTEMFDAFFSSTMKTAMKLITDTLTVVSQHQRIQAIFCVGGFGGSVKFHKEVTKVVKSVFHDDSVSVYRPEHHSTAVVRGAVAFGKMPDIVKSRVAGATYGTSCSSKFNPQYHSPQYFYEDDDKLPKCKNLFQPYILMNDVVKIDKSLAVTFHPSKHNQKHVKFKLFRSNLTDIKYTLTPDGSQIEGLCHIGELTMTLPPDTKNLDKRRNILLKFNFVHTEILVEAYDEDYDETISCMIDFLTKN